jgi:alkyldihydroxyacetonephosphate synthase
MDEMKMLESQGHSYDWTANPWYRRLCDIVGDENIVTNFAERLAYGRDRWPYANLKYRFGKFPMAEPFLVALPGTYEEVAEVVKLANEFVVPIVPYGFGSGALGGALPSPNGIILDLKRLNKLLEIDEISGLASAQAAMNGELFESALNRRRLTLGHFPQSLTISTIGGWLSCRGAGQASSRYGKIEDMVVGLKAVLPDGRFLEVRPVPRRAAGPSVKDILVGAEGTMGIILEATFRVLPYPERETVHAIGFKDYLTGLEALRKIMQAEIRPAVVRLYDENESADKIKDFPEYADYPCLAMLTFMGVKDLVEVEERLALDICKEVGGIEGSPEPAYKWMEHRYVSLSAKPIFEGRMMDTVEISASWRDLPEIYEGMKEVVHGVNADIHFGAHWSHVYSDGGCMYMTFKFLAPDDQEAAMIHRKVWEGVMEVCLKGGGSISHHHGIGYFRGKWLIEELNTGHDMLQTLKDGIDPNNIMNPGKLGFKE